jgi:rfaE bifunctional protein kinase chain/domain/rfaE bifunctional protein nucleotidyltransferase chain/domain
MSPGPKVCTIEQLLARRRAAGLGGRTVVHCHGCFDIIHPGHISYLQFARSLGDELVVTVSADPHVAGKGIGRPLIPDDLRAASLAALECVDHVYVNPHPTAVEVLEALRPDVYVKGREYETNQDPRFLAERDTVVGHGGRVVFSSGDVVFSSTALIAGLDEGAVGDERVRRFCQQYGLTGAAMTGLLHRCRGRRVVVVGDYIQDRYHFCDAVGVASEGPMMTLRPLRQAEYDGAAAVVALHLAGLGAHATLVTSLADDAASADVVDRLTEAGVTVRCVRQRKHLVTKSRYLVDGQKLMKVDDGSAAPLDSRWAAHVAELIESAATGADAVVFADFGYGLLTGPLLDRVLPAVRASVPIVTADVSGRQASLLRFSGVDLLCPTEREMRETTGDFASGLNAVASQLLSRTSAKAALVTLGKQGLCAFDQHRPAGGADESWDRRLRAAYLPSLATHAVDPLGCGDALLAVATCALAAGADVQAAAYLGSLAAALEVQQLGNHPVTAGQLLGKISAFGTATPASPPADRLPARLAS